MTAQAVRFFRETHERWVLSLCQRDYDGQRTESSPEHGECNQVPVKSIQRRGKAQAIARIGKRTDDFEARRKNRPFLVDYQD